MLGYELRARRKRLGLTQAALASLMCCSLPTIGNWERGDKPINGVTRIALEAVLKDVEAGVVRIPHDHTVQTKPRHPLAQAIRTWVLAHL